MCQAKPGPRCSPDMKHALDKANEKYKAAEQALWQAKREHGHMSPEYDEASKAMQKQYDNIRIAQRDYDGTPEGIQAFEASAHKPLGDPSAAPAYREAREARKEALKAVEAAEKGNLPDLNTVTSTLKVEDNGDGTYTLTQSNAPARNPNDRSEGSLVVTPVINEHGHTEYKTSLGRVYLTVHKDDSSMTPAKIAQQLHNNIVMRNQDSTYIDRQSAYMQKAHQASSTLQKAYDADPDNDPANFHEREELLNEYREVTAERDAYRQSLKEGAYPNSSREHIMDDNIQSLRHSLDQMDRQHTEGMRTSTRLLGAADAQERMSKIIKDSPTKAEAINKLRTLEPPFRSVNGQEIYNETYEPHYVAGFEKERAQLIKEALNYKEW